tara:strand:- start:2458 stop:2889 length:432 start_codon:yes stop_codon:yes gene_type:complete
MKNEDDSSELAFHSLFDPLVKVVIVYSGSIAYDGMQDNFKLQGVAFLIHDKKVIIVDGEVVKNEWFKPHHLQVIDAHEIGHLLISTYDTSKKNVEKCADYVGYNLVKDRKLDDAITLYHEEYLSRYGCYPEDDDKDLSYLIKK